MITTKSICCVCVFSPGKLLDIDDQYYQGLTTSRSEPSISTLETSPSRIPEQSPSPASRQTRERAVTEPEANKPAKDSRFVYLCRDRGVSVVADHRDPPVMDETNIQEGIID